MIVFVVAAFFYLGAQLAARLHRAAEISPLERAASAALLGTCIWIAVNWLLSAPHWLNRPALLIAAAIALIAALLLRLRLRGGEALMPLPGWDALFLLPLLAWLAFLLWRAYVLPIGSADALIYHMPRALLVSRAGQVFERGTRLHAIPGAPPDLARLPPGCAFAPRCDLAIAACRAGEIAQVTVGEDHWARCVRTGALAA